MFTYLKPFIISLILMHIWSVGASGSDVGVFFGSDSNPARAPGGPSGSYYQLTPSWEQTSERLNGYLLSGQVGAELKKFNDEKVALSSDAHLLMFGLSLVNNQWENFEIEASWGLDYFNGRMAPMNFAQSWGAESEFLSQKITFAATYLGSSLALTLGLKNSWKDFSTDVFDEQNNTFQDDNSNQALFSKWLFGIGDKSKFELGLEWNRQRFRYRSVRGEYGMSQLQGPSLVLENQEYYLAWILCMALLQKKKELLMHQ